MVSRMRKEHIPADLQTAADGQQIGVLSGICPQDVASTEVCSVKIALSGCCPKLERCLWPSLEENQRECLNDVQELVSICGRRTSWGSPMRGSTEDDDE
jgi:hypothetical protein